MYLQDLTCLVSLRSFLAASIDNLTIKLSREEVKLVQNRIKYIDDVLLKQMISPDFVKAIDNATKLAFHHQDLPGVSVTQKTISVESSEPTEEIMRKFSRVVRTEPAAPRVVNSEVELPTYEDNDENEHTSKE